MRVVRNHDRLAKRVCTDREIEMLARAPEEGRDALLLRLWTCKEAALKAVGIGLSGGARNVAEARARRPRDELIVDPRLMPRGRGRPP